MVRLTVNGVVREIDVDASGRTLLEVLREDLRLTGAKYGCGEGECGACTVLRGDTAVRACDTDIIELDGATITTIEGLAEGARLHPVQEAFVACRALQCGYCTPGMVMSAVALLRTDTTPDATAIRAAMAGNICRCGGYQNVVRAIEAVVAGGLERGDIAEADEPEPAASMWTAVLRLDDPAQPARGWGLTTPGGVRITIDDAGHVVGYCGKVDAGQGNRVALRRLVAAELGVPLPAVRMEMGDTGTTPYDLGTFGSFTTPDAGRALRLAASAMRVALAEAAASAWGVAADAVRTGGGQIRELDGARSMAYAELVAAGPRTIRVDPGGSLAPAAPGVAELGEDAANEVGVPAVTGAKRFPSDITVSGMWHGALLRPPAHGAVLESLDAEAIGELADVSLVHDGDFVAVAAPTPHAARAALALLRPVWRTTAQPAEADLYRYLRDNPAAIDPEREDPGREIGDVDKAAANADYVMQAEYTAAYIAHVPLEPRVALAVVGDADATVWVGTQRPFAVRAAVAAVLGLQEDQVRVVVPDFGGGFGGKHSPDVAIQAARLSRASGHPVRLAWTRAEELSWAYLRPAAVIDVRASATREGSLTGWELTNINAGGAGLVSPYATDNVREQFQPARSPLPQGSYRALAATVNNFARESHLDEVAARLGADPVQLRLRHLTDPRLADVLSRVAAHVDWPSRRAHGKPGDGVRSGLGIACGVEKGGRVATAAEVTVDPDGAVTVTRLVTGIDCGPVIDPSGLRNQVVGATVMGLGGALFEAIHFDHGRITSTGLSSYRVPRFTDVPEIEVLIVDRPDVAAAGAGEAPIITVAPAIANAIFAATGRRLQTMPLTPDGHLPSPIRP